MDFKFFQSLVFPRRTGINDNTHRLLRNREQRYCVETASIYIPLFPPFLCFPDDPASP